MDYSKLTNSILQKVLAALAIINNPEITPEVRQMQQEILFRSVGAAVYAKVYDMNAFDFEIQHTTGPGMDDRHYGLAKVASAAVVAGTLGLDEYVKNYLYSAASQAQAHAMTTARQSGKIPRATRTVVGEKNCKWCIGKQGTNVENPSPDFFHRHGGCDCNITTKGYMSRNGLLDNYKPRKAAA